MALGNVLASRRTVRIRPEWVTGLVGGRPTPLLLYRVELWSGYSGEWHDAGQFTRDELEDLEQCLAVVLGKGEPVKAHDGEGEGA